MGRWKGQAIYEAYVEECEREERISEGDSPLIKGRLDISSIENSTINDADEKRRMYENAARVAFPRLPETQKGERISDRELKMKMGQIRKTGYRFRRPYSQLNRTQLWALLGEVRQDIRTKLQ